MPLYIAPELIHHICIFLANDLPSIVQLRLTCHQFEQCLNGYANDKVSNDPSNNQRFWDEICRLTYPETFHFIKGLQQQQEQQSQEKSNKQQDQVNAVVTSSIYDYVILQEKIRSRFRYASNITTVEYFQDTTAAMEERLVEFGDPFNLVYCCCAAHTNNAISGDSNFNSYDKYSTNVNLSSSTTTDGISIVGTEARDLLFKKMRDLISENVIILEDNSENYPDTRVRLECILLSPLLKPDQLIHMDINIRYICEEEFLSDTYIEDNLIELWSNVSISSDYKKSRINQPRVIPKEKTRIISFSHLGKYLSRTAEEVSTMNFCLLHMICNNGCPGAMIFEMESSLAKQYNNFN